MLFDTGSCELWIPSIECVTKRCITHTRYRKSWTFHPYPQTISIQYLSGKITGDMSKETIGIGKLTIPNQIIGVANVVDIPLLDVNLYFINKIIRDKYLTLLNLLGSSMGRNIRTCLSK